MAFTTI